MTRLIALALATAALTAPAAAQDWRPEPGDRSMIFTLPVVSLRGSGGGSGTIGFWWQHSERTSLGLDFSGSLEQRTNEGPLGERTTQTASIGVAPALKRYLNQSGPTAPFFRAGLGTMVTRHWVDEPAETVTAWALGASASTAIGVDWFPAENIAIGGHGGVDIRYNTSEHSQDPYGHDQIRLATFTSGLRIQLYF